MKCQVRHPWRTIVCVRGLCSCLCVCVCVCVGVCACMCRVREGRYTCLFGEKRFVWRQTKIKKSGDRSVLQFVWKTHTRTLFHLHACSWIMRAINENGESIHGNSNNTNQEKKIYLFSQCAQTKTQAHLIIPNVEGAVVFQEWYSNEYIDKGIRERQKQTPSLKDEGAHLPSLYNLPVTCTCRDTCMGGDSDNNNVQLFKQMCDMSQSNQQQQYDREGDIVLGVFVLCVYSNH